MIGYDFSFDKDIFEYTDLQLILENVLPIKPHKMRIGAKSYKFNLKKIFDYIGSESGVSIYDEERKEQIHFGNFGASKHSSLSFVTNSEQLNQLDIDLIISQTGFSTCYVYDDDFVTWQQMTSIQYYEMEKKEYSHLKTTLSPTGQMRIDVSNHYGRKEFYFNTRLMVAPTMYISSKYEKQFPFEKLLNYSKAHSTELIKDGEIAKVVLFSNPLDSEKNYDLIKSFWFDFDYDELIKEFENSFG